MCVGYRVGKRQQQQACTNDNVCCTPFVYVILWCCRFLMFFPIFSSLPPLLSSFELFEGSPPPRERQTRALFEHCGHFVCPIASNREKHRHDSISRALLKEAPLNRTRERFRFAESMTQFCLIEIGSWSSFSGLCMVSSPLDVIDCFWLHRDVISHTEKKRTMSFAHFPPQLITYCLLLFSPLLPTKRKCSREKMRMENDDDDDEDEREERE